MALVRPMNSFFNRMRSSLSFHHDSLLRKNFLVIFLCVVTGVMTLTSSETQTLGDYRSAGTPVNWGALASWQRWNGGAWVTPTAGEGYPGQIVTGIAGTVTIQNGHVVTLNANLPF